VHLNLRHELEFAATDGHRLAVVRNERHAAIAQGEEADIVTPQDNNVELEVTIPTSALRELERRLVSLPAGEDTDPVVLQFEPGQIVFQVGEYRLSSRTLGEQYPDYKTLIPTQFMRQITLERRPLLAAVDRIKVMSDNRNNVLKLSVDSDLQELALTLEAADVGSAQENLKIEVSGDSFQIAFNIKYFGDALK
jgi:DNA polymerase-3 subunit beta